jgi:hypothetical protein
MRKLLVPAALAALLGACGSLPESSPDLAPAQELYARFVALNTAFDPAEIELYAPEAKAFLHVIEPTGEVYIHPVPRAEMERNMKNNAVAVKRAGMKETYGEPSFAREGNRVRIRTTYFITGMGKARPFSLLVGPNEAGQWLVYEVRETMSTRDLDGMMRRVMRPTLQSSEPPAQD